MNNREIADVFDEMADLLEIAGESSFRVRAYRTGAQVICDFPESIEDWVNDGKDLTTIDGIGSTLAEKSKTLVTTSKLPALLELREKIPPSLRTLLKVPGLGAKKVGVLFHELKVTDLTSLRAACDANLVQKLKGFGIKTEKAILDGLAIAEQSNQRLLLDQATLTVEQLKTYMTTCDAVKKIEFAGSYRRGKETIGDLDILVVSDDSDQVMDHFVNCSMRTETIAKGPTKSSIRVSDAFQVDLRVVLEASWGAALQYFTGSKEHNVALRSLAKKKGLRVNEYGVFHIEDETRSIAGKTEKEVYESLGLTYIDPEFRENRFEWENDFDKSSQDIVQFGDIRGDMHMHTTATDGSNTLEEMVEAAMARGLSYIAITDHSQRVSMARGLDPKRLLEQWAEIDRMNSKLDQQKFLILKGIECDILENGSMDLPDDVLAQADWVMASIHYGQKQPREQITARILNAIHNPHVTAISHPTGRLINQRESYAVDLEQVIEAVAKENKFLEINAQPKRLDLNDIHSMAAIAAGVKLVISTDAHSCQDLSLIDYGIKVARRAGVKRSQVFNTSSLSELKKWMKDRNSDQ